jgi:hypothetical protein
LACKLARLAVIANNHILVVVDGSPNEDIKMGLKEAGATIFPELHRGMGPSRRQAFFHAFEVAHQHDINIILWTEPEKVDLINSIPKIIEPIEIGEADIVIPCRSAKSWETWPAFQRESEQEANKVYNEVFGVKDFDPMFGPVAFDREFGLSFIASRGSESIEDTYIQHYAPREAAFYEDAWVKTEEIDMTYPPEQRAEEEGALNDAMREKRKQQLVSLTNAYRALALSFSI